MKIPVTFDRPVEVVQGENVDAQRRQQLTMYRYGRITGQFFNVPFGQMWYVRSIGAQFHTGGDVGNRYPLMWIYRPDPAGEMTADGPMLTLYQTVLWTQPASKKAELYSGPNQENFDSPTQFDDTFIGYRTFPNIPLIGGDYLWFEMLDALGTDHFHVNVVADVVEL